MTPLVAEAWKLYVAGTKPRKICARLGLSRANCYWRLYKAKKETGILAGARPPWCRCGFTPCDCGRPDL